MSSEPLRWIATCARGLEQILRLELEREGLLESTGEVGRAARAAAIGGIAFAGGLEAGLRANWRLRCANRVLLELASWGAETDEDLYQGARALVSGSPASGGGGTAARPKSAAAGELSPALLLTPERTFSILATTSRSRIRDTRWIALKVKDGLVDGQREVFGSRASVARTDPDLALRLRLHADRATLLLDTSGEPLDRRGYRLAAVAAPLREQLAAAAILASGWDGRGPVFDPMCGSGTLLAEAGAISAGLPPLRLRQRWALERLPVFDRAIWDTVRAEPFPAPGPDSALVGRDLDTTAVAAARTNLAAAGLGQRASVEVGDGFALEPPPGPGLVVLNPPYGDRLAAAPESWRRIGDLLKQRYSGWRAVVVAGDAALGKQIGLRPTQRIPVWNGPLEARLLVFDLW